MGVYLCRKNLSVAIPMIQKAFGATKAQTGDIISYSAAAYAMESSFSVQLLTKWAAGFASCW